MTPVSYPKRMPPKAAKRVYKGQTTVRTPAMRADEIEMRRTERIPAQTFLGALAPIPLPIASAPPAMIGRRVRMCGERRVVGGRGVLRSENAPSFMFNPGTRCEEEKWDQESVAPPLATILSPQRSSVNSPGELPLWSGSSVEFPLVFPPCVVHTRTCQILER